MPYVDRDQDGKVTAIYTPKQRIGHEFLSDDNSEVIAYINRVYPDAVARKDAIENNLPSWAQVDQAIVNITDLAGAKAFLRKLSRVVYWLARNRAD
jgi:hypothetical protein